MNQQKWWVGWKFGFQLGRLGGLVFSFVLYTKLQVLFYHLLINLKSMSSKSYKPLKDLQQKYKPLKEVIGSVHLLI